MELAVPLSREQIAAANRLHRRLKQWTLSDSALARLAAQLPGFDAEACLLKAVAVNALYGTQVFAVVRMARHIEKVIAHKDVSAAHEDLVETIASLPPTDRQKTARRHHSFAAKFCHFFVDSERFPIMDSYADKMLKQHLGSALYEGDACRPYAAFIRNFQRLRAAANHSGTNRELDHYLWIAGQRLKWKIRKDQGKEPKINAELNALFQNPSCDDAEDLEVLMPATQSPYIAGRL